MTLAAGTRLGPHEIVGPLGAGGMGEVYRAFDTRLGRHVAIKVLPDQLAGDAERLKRFEREARAASSLNHPNIVTIHEVGTNDGRPYLVMELVDGRTLRSHLEDGPLPARRVLAIAAQAAEGLARAHEAGLVHRDMKPENLMLAKDGLVKILDFGLARPGVVPTDGSDLATVGRITSDGVILGTVGYMSPEQARGGQVDFRSDQFSLGTILYEMLAGRRPFRGASVPETLAAIISKEPESLSAVSPETPPPLRWVVDRCLAKEPSERYAATRDLARDLSSLREHISEIGSGTLSVPARSRTRLAWALLTALIVASTLSFLAGRSTSRRAETKSPVRAFLDVQPNVALGFTLSPNGELLAYTTNAELATFGPGRERNSIAVRRLDEPSGRVLTGTEGGYFPFFSPDSRSLAFFANGKLKRVGVDGGPVHTVCDAPQGRGGSWGRDGTLVFAPDYKGPLLRVAAAGGVPIPATRLDASRGEGTHRFPQFLPDGRHFVYLAQKDSSLSAEKDSGIFAAELGSEARTLVLSSRQSAIYASGHLLWVADDRTLFTRPFDAERLRFVGEARPLDDSAAFWNGYQNSLVSASATGRLVYWHGPLGTTQLVWLDREGKRHDTLGAPVERNAVTFTPDGTAVADSVVDAKGNSDIWMYDTARGTPTRLTSHPGSGLYENMVFSPDGRRVFFMSSSAGHRIFVKDVARAEEERLLRESTMEEWPTGCSPDGRYLVFNQRDPETGFDIWLLPLSGEGEAKPFLKTRFFEGGGTVSPDGRWLAYVSDETGAEEVYVQSFPIPGSKLRISTSGGSGLGWRRNGKEFFYVSGDGHLMAMPVTLSPTFQAGTPTALFSAPNGVAFHPDGQRFLAAKGVEQKMPLALLLDWTSTLRR